ncbi:MAG: hypothetical protein JWN98_2077 [Abditibacteriota bacterium]|nr:hypothetical protein [Abditibacteriota bacterium]
MNRRHFFAFAAGALLLGNAPLMAQQARVSPPDVASAVLDGNRVTVYYSRPFTKDPKTGAPRKIWGGLVPFGQVWRLGANEATLLVTQQPLEVGGVTIPAGASTLFLLPQQDGPAKLIINKQVGQWGSQYDDKQDIGRIDMKTDTLDKSADQFTIAVAKNPDAAGGLLRLMWENTQYSVPFTVKK